MQEPIATDSASVNQLAPLSDSILCLPHRPRDQCGVVGVIGAELSARLAVKALASIQHRGEASCGVFSIQPDRIERGEFTHLRRRLGLIGPAFDDCNFGTELPGSVSIAHTRWPTAYSNNRDANELRNAHPLVANSALGPIAIVHNGNFTNAAYIRHSILNGSVYQTTTDTELVLHLLAHTNSQFQKESNLGSVSEVVTAALSKVEGAYAILLYVQNRIFAARDPNGFRPLVMGQTPEGVRVLASETCALDKMHSEFIREIAPGELLELELTPEGGIRSETSHRLSGNGFEAGSSIRSACSFESLYFARPDSLTERGNANIIVRNALGRQLAREQKIPGADIVIGIPDSGIPAAMGYASESGVPYELAFIRNHYIGRTFTAGLVDRRDKVEAKLSVVQQLVSGKSVVVVDDSIVRGTTSQFNMKLLWEANPREVHVVVAAPPSKFPCVWGIDTPSFEELAAARTTIEGIRQELGVTSLRFLSLEGFQKVMADLAFNRADDFCDACFSGNHRSPLPTELAEQWRRAASTEFRAE